MPTSNVTAKILMRGFTIQRWNDRIRPTQLVEADRYASSQSIAYMLGTAAEHAGYEIDWTFLITSGIYFYLRKLYFYDVKATINQILKKEYFSTWKKMDEDLLSDMIVDAIPNSLYKTFINIFNMYINSNNMSNDSNDFSNVSAKERSFIIVQAARKLSTYIEFEQIISKFNDSIEINRIEAELQEALLSYEAVPGFSLVKNATLPLGAFIRKVDSLRYQLRWSQAFKQPPVSVLGHMGIVATLSWFILWEIYPQITGVESIRNYEELARHTFYAGLYHDLPEVVTRDIVQPVKKKISTIDTNIIKKIEIKLLSELMGLIDTIDDDEFAIKLKEELYYYSIGYVPNTISKMNEIDEFTSRYIDDNKIVKKVDQNNELQLLSNFAAKPVLGSLVKTMDRLVAYLEAEQSVLLGIKDPELISALPMLKGILASKNNNRYLQVDISSIIRSIISWEGKF